MEFKLRPMQEKDLQITYEWRNDPEVLKYAQTSNPISFKEHEAHFRFNNSIKLIFELNQDPAGYVSCTNSEDSTKGEWGFHMSAKYRGKGLSQIMLQSALYTLKNEYGYRMLDSAVLKNNAKSKHLHYKLGFKYTHDKGDFHLYEVKL